MLLENAILKTTYFTPLLAENDKWSARHGPHRYIISSVFRDFQGFQNRLRLNLNGFILRNLAFDAFEVPHDIYINDVDFEFIFTF